jgi:hypothetical protein
MADKPYRTFAVARASIFVPTHKAVAQSNDIMEQLGREITSQKDLMYVKSVLVTAGINSNDDTFFVDELWKARKTPILKPLDWKHRDSEIIGVMYSAENYDLSSGKLIQASAESCDQPFEIVTEGVVYKLMFPDRAMAIQRSSEKGELFVSMECWFDDYNYVLFKDGEIKHIIARSSDTIFMDSCLRANGGEGIFSDPESGESYRIGRGLLGLTFGGCGFVPIPANTRSVIISVNDDEGNNSVTEKDDCVNVLSDDEIAQIFDIINKQESVIFASGSNKEVCEMTDVKAEVKKALDETKAQDKAEAKMVKLEQEAARAGSLDSQKSELEGKIKTLNSQHDALITSFTDTFKVVVKVVAEAGLPEPAEAKSAEEAMQIKLAWFQKTVATLVDEAKKAKTLQEKFDNIEKEARAETVKALLVDILDEEKIESFVEVAKAMDEEAYGKWLDEKKLLVESVKAKLAEVKSESESESTEGETEGETKEDSEGESEGAPKEAKKKEEKKEKKPKEKKEEKEAEANQGDVKLLENVEVETEPNLAGASGEEEDTDPGGYKALATAVCPTKEDKMDKSNKPGFDPVN